MFRRLETLEQSHWQFDMNNLSVEGHPNLYRDSSSGAIINKNTEEYESYMKSYQMRQQQSHRLDKVEDELKEIKNLLNKLIEKL